MMMEFRRQYAEMLIFDAPTREPVFQQQTFSFKTGSVMNDQGDKIALFKMKLVGNRPLVDPTFKAYRSWSKQRPW
jgi:hypothetical protein